MPRVEPRVKLQGEMRAEPRSEAASRAMSRAKARSVTCSKGRGGRAKIGAKRTWSWEQNEEQSQE